MKDSELVERIQKIDKMLNIEQVEKIIAYIRFAGVYIVIPTEKEIMEYITEVIEGISIDSSSIDSSSIDSSSIDSSYTKINYNGVNYIILSELDLPNLDTFIENFTIYDKGYKEEVNKKEYYVYRLK